MKLTARKHIHGPPRRNAVPTESHSDGQDAGYFPRTLRTVLLELGSSEPPLFVGTPRPTTDHTRRIRQVVEAPALRWTFEADMREATHEALAVLRHEADERMVQSQYRHFPS
jgi:hypothetical protein